MLLFETTLMFSVGISFKIKASKTFSKVLIKGDKREIGLYEVLPFGSLDGFRIGIIWTISKFEE